MRDSTRRVVEEIRRREQYALNTNAAEREELERRHGDVWSIEELGRDFIVHGFLAPYVVVTRKSDGKKGSLRFQHNPRFYFNWEEN